MFVKNKWNMLKNYPHTFPMKTWHHKGSVGVLSDFTRLRHLVLITLSKVYGDIQIKLANGKDYRQLSAPGIFQFNTCNLIFLSRF